MVFNQSPNTCSLQPTAEDCLTQSPCVMLSILRAHVPGLHSPPPFAAHRGPALPGQRTEDHTAQPWDFVSPLLWVSGGTASPLARLPAPVILYLTVPWWLLQILGEIMVLQLSIWSLAQTVHIPQKADSLVRQRSGKQKHEHPQRDNTLPPKIYPGSTQEACGRAKSRSRLPPGLNYKISVSLLGH